MTIENWSGQYVGLGQGKLGLLSELTEIKIISG